MPDDEKPEPENDPALLHAELDGCRAEIEKLRDLGIELLGAGRGLYEWVSGATSAAQYAMHRWDAVDALAASGPVNGDRETNINNREDEQSG